MALDNWFQHWPPPFFQQHLHHDPIKNYSSDHNYHSRKKFRIYHTTDLRNIIISGKKLHNPAQFLPLFMSLNLLKSEAKKPERNNHKKPDSFHRPKPRRNKAYSYESVRRGDVEDDHNFRFPENIQKIIDHPESHGRSYDYLGFPDPFEEKPKKNQTYEEEHNLKPLEVTGPFKTWYRWKVLDFAYPTQLLKSEALAKGEFIPENNLPLGKYNFNILPYISFY